MLSKRKKNANKEEVKQPENLDNSFEEQKKKENSRPDSLFYRIFKFIMKTDPGAKTFIDVI